MTARVLRVAQTVGVAIIACVASCVAGATAQDSASANHSAVVQGEIVELPCYMVNGGGVQNPACARCSTQLRVAPLGVVTDSGALFLLVNEAADPEALEVAKGLAGQRAELTGKLVSRRGVASLIVESARQL